jgi:Family of unknown function (DUF6496)
MKKETKVGKVMHEFKTGKLHSGKSGKIVKNPKQAIAIALSEARKGTKGYAEGGAVKGSEGESSAYGTQVGDHNKFLNSDGYLKGGIDVEVSNPQETQLEPVKGQRRMMPEKRTKAKWF